LNIVIPKRRAHTEKMAKLEEEREESENERRRFDLQRDKIRLALEIMEKTGLDPHSLPDEQKLALVNRLTPPLTVVLESDLQLASDTSQN
jgi:hypothetical protein